MRRARHIAPTLCLALLAAGCAFQRYRYFSFEDAPGTRVQERGSPDLPRLHLASLPLLYSVAREGYALGISVPAPSHPYLPSVAVRPLTAQVVLACRVGTASGCVACTPVEGDASALLFSAFRCREPGPYAARVSFDVLGADGSRIAAEDIPFALETSGFYSYTDLP